MSQNALFDLECCVVKNRICQGPDCDLVRMELAVIDYKGCDGETREYFDVSAWRPEQFERLREFIRNN